MGSADQKRAERDKWTKSATIVSHNDCRQPSTIFLPFSHSRLLLLCARRGDCSDGGGSSQERGERCSTTTTSRRRRCCRTQLSHQAHCWQIEQEAGGRGVWRGDRCRRNCTIASSSSLLPPPSLRPPLPTPGHGHDGTSSAARCQQRPTRRPRRSARPVLAAARVPPPPPLPPVVRGHGRQQAVRAAGGVAQCVGSRDQKGELHAVL